eukprot:GGOE01036114.1.p1 GENE.GGOE01036114.1~~GGOE01036114.1.p1  ORF type:complete len:123 (-),score=5.83 GGOE01036114.1:30-398(-)
MRRRSATTILRPALFSIWCWHCAAEFDGLWRLRERERERGFRETVTPSGDFLLAALSQTYFSIHGSEKVVSQNTGQKGRGMFSHNGEASGAFVLERSGTKEGIALFVVLLEFLLLLVPITSW